MQSEADQWLRFVKAALAGRVLPARQQIRPLNQVIAQLRGRQFHKAQRLQVRRETQETEDAKIEEIEGKLRVLKVEAEKTCLTDGARGM